MENTPSILIVSSSNTKPKSLIKLITKKIDINPDTDNTGILKQVWEIDTKYYTANVNLLGLENDLKIDELNVEDVEALIIHMDTNKVTGLDDLSKWESLESNYSLDIKLLVCNYCTDDTKITRNNALEWCMKRGFEFVELYPFQSTPEEDEDDFKEKNGVERIIEALQSHTWSNLVMKTKSNSKQHLNVFDGVSSSFLETSSSVLKDSFRNDTTDDFTELFSQLHMMKDNLQNMPMNQRKQCAEQMVTAFWKAIGGEEEDLLDL